MHTLTVEQERFLVEYLQENFWKVKSINRQHSAYGLKQRFSRENFYVTQEQFTAAMRSAGFDALELGDGNACFNIGESSPYFK